MKLQQLKYAVEVLRQGLNVSAAAEALHTSQPGISKQIRLLEDELGSDIFVRNGKRVVDVTEAGKQILAYAERVLHEAENLKNVGKEFSADNTGSFTIATTHTQARYVLPPVIKKFTDKYPGVKLNLHQGNPTQVAEEVVAGRADLAIATEGMEFFNDLVLLPCYKWNRCVVTPADHPLLSKPLTLEALAKYPIITYDFAFTGRSKINQAFEARGLTPNVVLTALDSDVIKTYVELGLGVGILAAMAFEPARDVNLRVVNAEHLFESSLTRIGIRRGSYMRKYVYDFIELFSSQLNKKTVEAAMAGTGSDYEL
jgi:LysR family transcriptional regulator, cys regulon transcriptional activator